MPDLTGTGLVTAADWPAVPSRAEQETTVMLLAERLGVPPGEARDILTRLSLLALIRAVPEGGSQVAGGDGGDSPACPRGSQLGSLRARTRRNASDGTWPLTWEGERP